MSAVCMDRKAEVVGFCLNWQKQEAEGWPKTVWLQCNYYVCYKYQDMMN